jgi:hypothetical protein
VEGARRRATGERKIEMFLWPVSGLQLHQQISRRTRKGVQILIDVEMDARMVCVVCVAC